MSYHVKEIFYSIQGEGAQAGRAAVFCRFAGCNLWSGREQDREQARCTFCDTEFRGTDGPGGGVYGGADELAQRLWEAWPQRAGGTPLVICTGGEPLLQLDGDLVQALHRRGFQVAVETNGTQPAPAGIDWLCVSPKAGEALAIRAGDELKLIYPQEQPGAQPECFAGLDFRHFFLQPLDGPKLAAHTDLALGYCLAHPQWRLSLQLHKMLGCP